MINGDLAPDSVLALKKVTLGSLQIFVLSDIWGSKSVLEIELRYTNLRFFCTNLHSLHIDCRPLAKVIMLTAI